MTQYFDAASGCIAETDATGGVVAIERFDKFAPGSTDKMIAATIRFSIGGAPHAISHRCNLRDGAPPPGAL